MEEDCDIKNNKNKGKVTVTKNGKHISCLPELTGEKVGHIYPGAAFMLLR